MKINNFEDVEKALSEFAQTESSIAKKEAEMNAKIQKIKDSYDEDTRGVRATRDLLYSNIERFCISNKFEFIKQRSKSFIAGVLGFRTNPPRVQLLNRKYNLKTALELIRKIFKGKYVRSKEEINKDEILVDYSSGTITDDKLASVGLKIDQDETFFVEINWDSLKTDAA